MTMAPDFAEAYNRAAWIGATATDADLRDGAKALANVKKAIELARKSNSGVPAYFIDTLAAAYAELGRFNEAAEAQADYLQRDINDRAEAKRRLQLYQSGKPYRMER